MALLPPGRNFFRLDIPADAIASAATNARLAAKITDWRRVLAAWEASAQAVVDGGNWRIQTAAGLQQLLNAGNVLEYMGEDSNMKLFRLDQYVLRRDWYGNLIELVIEEKMSKAALPEEAQGLLKGDQDEDNIPIYTYMERTDNDTFYVFQEVDESIVPNSQGQFLLRDFPYNPLRWSATPGEDYGRSMVEEHGGDLRSLEGLEKALLEGSSMASRNFIMIKPTATAGGMRKRIAQARNGDVLVGDFDKMMMMSFENKIGMQLTAEYAERIERRLRGAFLLKSSGV
jgi:hypothetical protein